MPESNAAVWDQVYDREDDVYYVSFGTGEPSYCVEVNDELVVEVGLFSNLPTGYRLLNIRKLKTERRPIEEVKEHLREVLRSLPQMTVDDRKADVERSLDKVLA